MSFTVPLPPRTQFYHRSCSNKHTLVQLLQHTQLLSFLWMRRSGGVSCNSSWTRSASPASQAHTKAVSDIVMHLTVTAFARLVYCQTPLSRYVVARVTCHSVHFTDREKRVEFWFRFPNERTLEPGTRTRANRRTLCYWVPHGSHTGDLVTLSSPTRTVIGPAVIKHTQKD